MHDSALLISTRDRIVYTKADGQALDRCAKQLNAHGDKMLVVCGNATCPSQKIVMVPDHTAGGRGMILRCGCRDRIFEKAF